MLKWLTKLMLGVIVSRPLVQLSRQVARDPSGLPVSPDTPDGPCVPARSKVLPPTMS